MYFRKKQDEELVKESTAVWTCEQEDCKGWMRDNFSFEDEPKCPICSSSMKRDTKMLPVLANPTGDPKAQSK